MGAKMGWLSGALATLAAFDAHTVMFNLFVVVGTCCCILQSPNDC